jgi:hypothetical protein
VEIYETPQQVKVEEIQTMIRRNTNRISQEHEGSPAAPTSPMTPAQVDEAKLRDTPVMIDFHNVDPKVESELRTREEVPNLDPKSLKQS